MKSKKFWSGDDDPSHRRILLKIIIINIICVVCFNFSSTSRWLALNKQICSFTFAIELLLSEIFRRILFLCFVLTRVSLSLCYSWDFPYRAKHYHNKNSSASSRRKKNIKTFIEEFIVERSAGSWIWIQIVPLSKGTFYMLTTYRLRGKLMSAKFLRSGFSSSQAARWITNDAFSLSNCFLRYVNVFDI